MVWSYSAACGVPDPLRKRLIFRTRFILFQREPIKECDIENMCRRPTVEAVPNIRGNGFLPCCCDCVSDKPLLHGVMNVLLLL